MSEVYVVDGFRSLHNFTFQVRPGLNVLVGPNGAGKTNIIAFMEFISAFVSKGTTTAVIDGGGTAAVFSIETSDEESATLRFGASGTCKIRSARSGKATESVNYNYMCDLRFVKNQSSLVIVTEELRFSDLWRTKSKALPSSFALNNFIRIERDHTNLDATPQCSVHIASDALADKFGKEFNIYGPKVSHAEFIRRVLADHGPHASILNSSELTYQFLLTDIRQDIFVGYNYNIIPSQAKMPDDLSATVGVQSDGSSLSATLNALKNVRPDIQGPIYRRRQFPEDASFEDVENLTALVNDFVEGIEVQANMELGKYIAKLKISRGYPSSGTDCISIPLHNASDGTVKWIALITALITRAPMAAIEEPENYLHPAMQGELVRLCRERLENSIRQKFLILSTHSETLINHCSPDELVVISLEDGKTRSSRPDNAKELEKEIRKTGFGLGYFYVANAVS